MARPSVSVMVICVLLNVAAMCTRPCGTTRRSRFFLNSFLRLAAAAGFPAAPVSGVAAAGFCSFATFAPFLRCSESLARKSGSKLPHSKRYRAGYLALLADGLLLRCYRTAPWTLARARVGVRPLAAHRQVSAVADSAIGLNFDQPADVHLNLLAEIAFHAPFLLDSLADVVDFLLGQVADLLGMIHAGFSGESLRALAADSVDGGQTDPQTLLNWKINTGNACHTFSLSFLALALFMLRIGANYAHHPAPMNHLALVANLFYRRPYFHNPSSCLFVTIHNTAARQIVWRKLHRHFISRQNADEILAHFAGNVRQHLMLVLQLHPKHGIRQRLNNRGHHFNGVLLGISGVAFLFSISLEPLRHNLLCCQDKPCRVPFLHPAS